MFIFKAKFSNPVSTARESSGYDIDEDAGFTHVESAQRLREMPLTALCD